MGNGPKGYYVMDWIVNRGHGSQRVSNTFKKIVHNSHQSYRLPTNIQKKLNKGPRIASFGYGMK